MAAVLSGVLKVSVSQWPKEVTEGSMSQQSKEAAARAAAKEGSNTTKLGGAPILSCESMRKNFSWRFELRPALKQDEQPVAFELCCAAAVLL
jgi:hypothetical protein